MNNKRGELKLVGLLLAMITAFGLFFGLIAFTMDSMSTGYDTTGYDSSNLDKYNYLDDVSGRLINSTSTIEGIQVNSNVFDWFAGVWNKLTSPFRLIFGSYNNLITATGDATTDLNLPPIYKDYFSAAIIILVVIGIVMIKFYFGRNK